MNLLAASLLALLLSAEGGAPVSPAELACLARHYAVKASFDNGAWFALLPDGGRVPFDDGKRKTFDERLASPDVKDIFFVPYHPGSTAM